MPEKLSVPRLGAAAVAVDRQVYVFGGINEKGMRGDGERFQPGDDATTLLPAKLLPRLYHGAAVVGGNVFLMGGLAAGQGVSKTVERYSLKDGTVTRGAPMPTPRRGLAAVTVGKYVFVVGGSDESGKGLPTLEAYDTEKDTWTRGAPMAHGRECMAVFWRGLIIVPGGYDGKTAQPLCEAYSVAQARWIPWPSLPVATSAHHGALVGDTLFTFGDYAQADRVLACDLSRSQWRVVQGSGFRPRRHNAVACIGRTVFVMGGIVDRGPIQDTIQGIVV